MKYFRKDSPIINLLKSSILLLFTIICLYFISLKDYLLFHTFVEIIAIAVAFCIFIIVWNTRKVETNSFFLIIGISFLFIGFIDLLHTLAYKGMGVFPGSGPDLPTQLWVTGRYFQSCAFLIATFFIGRSITRKRRYDSEVIILVCTLVCSLMLASIFIWHIFPPCFIEGIGLTPFKITSEYIISAILTTTIIIIYIKRAAFDPDVWRLLVAAQIFLIMGELAFTSYISVYGFMNMLGHLFRLISVFLFYRALVVVSLTKPYNLLFRELKQSEKDLKESDVRFRSLFEHMEEGNALHELIYDDKGNAIEYMIVEVNTAFEKILNLPRNEVVGKVSREVYHVAEPPFLEIYSRIEQSKEADSFETYFPELKKFFSISAYSPKKGQFATIFTDITERKKSENALKQTNKKLNLLSGITRHDILNEIQIIFICLDLIQNFQLDSQILKYLKDVDRSAHNIERQIAFTRDYENIGINYPIWQNISYLITKAAHLLDLGQIQIHIDITGIEVYADPLMAKVFFNLMDNAKRYGEKITEIRFFGIEDSNRYTIVCEDNGIGIPDEYKLKIFNREYYKHTGFGLNLSRDILDITGITIREAGNPGKGARFEIQVPEGGYRFIQ